jgi:hypothetical protein
MYTEAEKKSFSVHLEVVFCRLCEEIRKSSAAL